MAGRRDMHAPIIVLPHIALYRALMSCSVMSLTRPSHALQTARPLNIVLAAPVSQSARNRDGESGPRSRNTEVNKSAMAQLGDVERVGAGTLPAWVHDACSVAF
eukprot:scaffold123725_cov63-Phaeocystis_antarctica.AAC.5